MFMNTINSADLRIMQDFFYTFMTGSCRLVGNQVAEPEFNIPGRIIGEGPRHTAHYLLGTFLMYPDLVTKMRSCSITTSNTWSGTKITVEVEVHATKVATLPMEVWMPHKDCLPCIYQQPSVQHMVQLVQDTVPNFYDFSANLTLDSTVPTDGTHVTVMAVSDNNSSSNNNSVYADPWYVNTNNNGNSSSNSLSVDSNIPPASTVDSMGYEGRSYIPPSYIETLCEGLVPLVTPLSLHSVGRVEFYLDESNHIQLFTLSLSQATPHSVSSGSSLCSNSSGGMQFASINDFNLMLQQRQQV